MAAKTPAEIRKRGAGPHGPTPRLAGNRHQSGHALGNLVDARPAGYGPSCPKPEMLA